MKGIVRPHDLLAKLYVMDGQPELAIEQAKLALAANPNDQAALYQEMMAVRRMGNKEELRALSARLNAIREQSNLRKESTPRYQLEDNVSH